jgi:hypothetical protein
VVAHQHPLVGGDEVAPVVQALGGRGAGLVERQHPRGDEGAVETIGQQENTHGGDDEPGGVDGFVALQRNRAQTGGATQRYRHPQQSLERFLHVTGLGCPSAGCPGEEVGTAGRSGSMRLRTLAVREAVQGK